MAVIGKDAFKQMVIQLDDAGIEMDGEAIRCLVMKLLRNVSSFGMVLETLESLSDLVKDLTPVVKQIGLDGVKKFYEFEQKGYFEVLNQIGNALDTIVTRYSKEELSSLSENLVAVFDTLAVVSDRKVLEKIDAIFSTLKEIKVDEVEEYSVWRMMRDMKKPEVKKSIGFMFAFLAIINEKNKLLS